MNTTQNSSLKADIGRVLPVDLPRGNWADSVHKGALIDGAGDPIDLVQDADYYVIDFVNDSPILWDIGLVITDFDDPNYFYYSIGADITVNHTVAGITAQTLIAATVTEADQYTQISGLTTTNDVPVKGYLGVVTIPDFAIAAGVVTGEGSIRCVSQAPVLYGLQTVGTGERVVGVATPEANCYLLETAYTQAMRDAGNWFAVAGTTWKIVGLCIAAA